MPARPGFMSRAVLIMAALLVAGPALAASVPARLQATSGPVGAWSILSATGTPPANSNSDVAVFDVGANRMLLYYQSDVWALSLDANPQWTLLQVSGTKPPARDAECGIMDPVRHRLIIFGGYSQNNYDNTTWILTLDGTPTWTQLVTGGPQPDPRLYASAIYDPIRDRMIVFGGENGLSQNNVWALSFSGTPAWTQLLPTGTPPSPRYAHVAIYDPLADRMLMFGGWEGNVSNAELWSLTLDANPAWTQIAQTATWPQARVYPSAIYDTQSQRMVLHAGHTGSTPLSDTWGLDLGASPTWEQLQPTGVAPVARWLHTAIYDSTQGRMVVFGGSGTGDLRALTWGVNTIVGPPVISGFAPKFGKVGDNVIISGTSLGGATDVEINGVPAPILNDNYFVLNTMVPAGATSGPISVTTPYGTATTPDTLVIGEPPEIDAAVPTSGKIDAPVSILGHHFALATVVAFHGIGSTPFTIVSDTLITTTVDPAATTGPLLVVNRFGATTSAFDFTVLPWEPRPQIVSVVDAPNDQGGKVVLKWIASDYDAKRIHTVTNYRVWRRAPLDGTGEFWEALATVPSAQLKGYAYTAVTLQDSLPDSNPYSDFFVQALTLDPLTFYSSDPDSGYSVDNLSPPMPAPFVATYLANSTELHWSRGPAPDLMEFRLYRGTSTSFTPGPGNLVAATRDTQFVDDASSAFYKLAAVDIHGNVSRYALVTPELPVATLASLIDVEGLADRIRLAWYAGGNPGLVATLYRRTETSEWAAIASLTADGLGYLRYEDADVTTGIKYGYRLGIQDGGAEVFAGEAWATAERPVLALAGVVPNPSIGRAFDVHFVLSTAEEARIELLDIGGRRVADRELGSLGPGRHDVDFAEAGSIPPGVYLIRLTQGRAVRLARAVVLH